MPTPQSGNTFSAFTGILRFIRPYWKAALMAPLLMVLEVAMDLTQPLYLEQIIDSGIATGDIQVVIWTGLKMVGVAVIGLIGGVGCTYYAIKAAHETGADIRSELFRKVNSSLRLARFSAPSAQFVHVMR